MKYGTIQADIREAKEAISDAYVIVGEFDIRDEHVSNVLRHASNRLIDARKAARVGDMIEAGTVVEVARENALGVIDYVRDNYG